MGVSSQITGIETDDSNYRLLVNWSSGAVGDYPYAFLRDNAPADHTIAESELRRFRRLTILNLDPDIKPTKVTETEKGIQLKWPDVEAEVEYSSQWLNDHDLQCEDLRADRDIRDFLTKKVYWNKDVAKEHCVKPFDYEKCLTDEMEMYRALNQLSVFGMLMIENMPCDNDAIVRWGNYFQGIMPNHYGALFEVKNKAEMTNLAYSDGDLGFHTDMAYVQDQPPIQLFQCLAASDIGGETILADGFHIAEELRKSDPEAFKILCDTEFQYVDRGKDIEEHYSISKHPIITLNSDGRLEKICTEEHMRYWRMACHPSKVRTVLKAYKTFLGNSYKVENVLEIKLRAGQMLVTDNHRLLHGRKAFKVSSGFDRHLLGGYVSWDIVRSKLRVFGKKFGKLD